SALLEALMRASLAAIAAVFVVTAHPTAPSGVRGAAAPTAAIDGLWEAVIVSGRQNRTPSFEIPLRFESGTKGHKAEGFCFEGDRRVGSSSGTVADGAIKLEYDHLNTILELALDGDTLKGTYRNNRANARPQEVRMRRFVPISMESAQAPALAGT